jgi:hypothetical protein
MEFYSFQNWSYNLNLAMYMPVIFYTGPRKRAQMLNLSSFIWNIKTSDRVPYSF